MSLARASTPALVGLACLALAVYAVAEKSVTPVHADAYKFKQDAMRLMSRAERAIADAKRDRGLKMDPRNDPDGGGMVGPQFTLITTDRGSQSAKALAAHPNFAAAVAQMLLQAGIRPGDVVAVGMTGSLPGMNLAVLSACQAVGAAPILITSVGASMFGATDPEMTWLDMESVCVAKGLWTFRSQAASVGGGGDIGRGLSPSGHQLIIDAIERNHVARLESDHVPSAVRMRVAFYDSLAAMRQRPIRLYINVGGGVVSLGGSQNGRLIPPGYTRRLAARSYPNHGVVNAMAERGLPLIHLLQVEKLARDFGITDLSGETVKPGKGLVFIKYKYNMWLVVGAAAVVFASNLLVLRMDIRHKLLGRPHPERTPLA